MQSQPKTFFLVGFSIGALACLGVLTGALHVSLAADVDVSATVEAGDDGGGGGGGGGGDDMPTPPNCGDGVIDSGEECDDGNLWNGDGCSQACQLEFCGNTVVEPHYYEECDLGSFNSDLPDAACRTNCQPQRCGDGITDPSFGEACDDGNDDATDQCDVEGEAWNATGACSLTFCGDGLQQDLNGQGVAEECDDLTGAFNGYCANAPTTFCDTDAACGANGPCLLDSCSATCLDQLVINPIWVDPLNSTTATVNWWTTIDSDSTLQLGVGANPATCAYTQTFQSPTLVNVHAFNLSSLTPATTYCFRVTSQAATLQDTRVGGFTTLPASGIPGQLCGNGISEGTEACDDGNTTEGRCLGNNVACNTDASCGVNGPCMPDGCSADCSVINLSLCGNGVVDPGEQCDLGQGTNSDTAPNTCRTDCRLPFCGDAVIDDNEACDNGSNNSNTVANACRLDCTESRCGDSVVDSGEACDDGNTTYAPGDACAANCTPGLTITSHTPTAITNTSATINWTTTLVGDSTLEWGPIQAAPILCDYDLPNELTSPTLLTNHSLIIPSGLTPGTIYCYRVTSRNGVLKDSALATFQALGGAGEICTDGIDNNNNGFCDFPGSTCTDGSAPGDPDCLCTANFVCTPGACVNGIQIVSCADQNSCQASYTYDQGCSPTCQISCGAGQTLDVESCSCISQIYCGNGICERPSEDEFSCPADCPTSCLPDWSCTDWSECLEGVQQRDCIDVRVCGSNLGRPDVTQSCAPGCSISCAIDEQIDVSACTCEKIVPFCGNDRCEAGESHASCPQDCIPVCSPNWTCLAWGDCQDGVQNRECYDLNVCGLNLDRPPEVRSCAPNCDVACGTCQQLDLNSCSCIPQAFCCGNALCEEGETTNSCGVDCGLPPGFRLGVGHCLDGLDNDGDGLVDFPQDPGCRSPSDQSERNFNEIAAIIQDFVVDKILDNPVVEEINVAAAPALVAVVALNTLSAFSFFNFASYARYLFSQPLAMIARRRRKKWGTIYNALTKVAIDLAIVRLYRHGTNQLLQSRVTDKQGRYNFLVEPGTYYISVTKPKFTFPSVYLKDKREDMKYLDLYHGEPIEVTDKAVTISANIPLDPVEQEAKPAIKVLMAYYLRKIQIVAAFTAVPVALISFVISPGWFTGSLVAFHVLLFLLFRRLGYQRKPKNWGVVYDKQSRKPIGRAITRIYDKEYNKLLETRVTDGKGRYAFLVDNNVYYVTAERTDYGKATSDVIDLSKKEAEAFVDVDLGLEKGDASQSSPQPAAVPLAKPPAEKPTSATDPTKPAGISRESLEKIQQRKNPDTTKPADLESEPKKPEPPKRPDANLFG